MNPGRQNTQISIQSKTVTVDNQGSATEEWSDSQVLWAERIDQGGREFRAAGNVMAETTTLWRFWTVDAPSVTTSDRIKSGSFIFDINAAYPDPANRGKTLIQSKRTAP